MAGNDRFQIIFDKIRENNDESAESQVSIHEIEAIMTEADAVAELREIITETMEPRIKFYTTT